MKPERPGAAQWGVIAVLSCLAVGAVAYLVISSRAAETPTPPQGSVYYQGRMSADIESEAHDPRNRKNGVAKNPGAPPAKG